MLFRRRSYYFMRISAVEVLNTPPEHSRNALLISVPFAMRKCPSVCPTPLASLVSVNMAEALANPKGAFNFNLPACAPHEILILHTFYVQPLHSLDLLLSL